MDSFQSSENCLCPLREACSINLKSCSLSRASSSNSDKVIVFWGLSVADGSLWQPNKYTKIYSEHFIGNAKSEHPFSPSFLPTIFL
ncbi:hypothetical protein NQ318_005479 [Aromia moschata]|uniref:Uncharacterized protein n=1 Tax=Aromia moschata TaxID=1265417 RepID=A0AAV8XQ42_9CUCU|nr:hypothetical protein NQ318_005479 [Aromia moschata]